MKLLFDDTMSLLSRQRSNGISQDQAWETLRYQTAADAQVVKHLAQLNAVTSGQTGQTEGEQTVSPIRTGTGDTVAAASYPANRAVDTATATVADAAAGIATANEALSTALAQLVNAVNTILVAAAGNAAGTAKTAPSATS